MTLCATGITIYIVNIATLMGVILGFLGSLLLAYDVIDIMIIIRFLKVVIPSTIAAIFGAIYIFSGVVTEAGAQIAIIVLSAMIGAYTGIFFGVQDEDYSKPPLFSREFCKFGSATAFIFAGSALLANWYFGVKNGIADGIQAVIFLAMMILVSGLLPNIIYSYFRGFLNILRKRRFSLTGAWLGLFLGIVIFTLYDFSYDVGLLIQERGTNDIIGTLLSYFTEEIFVSLFLSLLPSFVIGGMTRYIIPWASGRKDKWYSKIGFSLFVISFFLQIIGPLFDVRGAIIR